MTALVTQKNEVILSLLYFFLKSKITKYIYIYIYFFFFLVEKEEEGEEKIDFYFFYQIYQVNIFLSNTGSNYLSISK